MIGLYKNKENNFICIYVLYNIFVVVVYYLKVKQGYSLLKYI